jgi:hypothetical protein
MEKMDHNKISNNGFEFTFIPDTGEWIWKAVPFVKLPVPEHDKPPFKVCNEIEDNYHNSFNRALSNIAKDIQKYLAV